MSEKQYKLKAYQDVYYFYLNNEFMNEVKSDIYISSAPKGRLCMRGYSFESLWNFINNTKYYYVADACCYRTLFKRRRAIEFFDHTFFNTILRESPKKLHGCKKLHSWKMIRHTDEVIIDIHNTSGIPIEDLFNYCKERVDESDFLEG